MGSATVGNMVGWGYVGKGVGWFSSPLSEEEPSPPPLPPLFFLDPFGDFRLLGPPLEDPRDDVGLPLDFGLPLPLDLGLRRLGADAGDPPEEPSEGHQTHEPGA